MTVLVKSCPFHPYSQNSGPDGHCNFSLKFSRHKILISFSKYCGKIQEIKATAIKKKILSLNQFTVASKFYDLFNKILRIPISLPICYIFNGERHYTAAGWSSLLKWHCMQFENVNAGLACLGVMVQPEACLLP